MSFDWFNYLNCGIEAVSLLVFWNVISEKALKKYAYPITFLLLCMASIFFTIVDSILFSILPINFIIVLICFLIGCYGIPWKNNVLQTVFSYSSLIFLQALWFCLLPDYILGTQWGNMIVNTIVLFCAILLALLAKRFNLNSIYIQNKQTIWFFLIVLFLPEIIIGQLFMFNLYKIRTVNMLSLLLIQVIYILLLAFVLLVWKQRLRNRQFAETQKHLSTLNEFLDDSRQRSHDFHKHLRYLRHLVNTEKDIEALTNKVDIYCDELMEEFEADDILLYLDDSIFRVLLYGRQAQAKRQHIQFILNAC